MIKRNQLQGSSVIDNWLEVFAKFLNVFCFQAKNVKNGLLKNNLTFLQLCKDEFSVRPDWYQTELVPNRIAMIYGRNWILPEPDLIHRKNAKFNRNPDWPEFAGFP